MTPHTQSEEVTMNLQSNHLYECRHISLHVYHDHFDTICGTVSRQARTPLCVLPCVNGLCVAACSSGQLDTLSIHAAPAMDSYAHSLSHTLGSTALQRHVDTSRIVTACDGSETTKRSTP
eukprot:Blabericola_migrator_1__6875@NODE_347_length_9536_cov_48_697223_g279_i0_p5_GENE_NODE_347_length_9536_cov_48_697223_g279_i0NODE_347_length_9536_cov_48_697223_g279_i0_p5_ORF_typecomplete_len120_score2_77_NODE_347_length_9536_cov_48_697223_g279_i056876046